MKKGQEAKARINDVTIYHQNLPSKQLRPHSHMESHLFFPLKGDIWVNDVRIPPGKMYLLAGGEKHDFRSTESQGERLIVMGRLQVKETGIYPANNLIKEVLFHLISDPKNTTVGSSLSLFKGLVKQVSSEPSFDISQLHSKAKDERVQKAIQYMDEDLEKDMSSIAKEVGASTKTLTRLFSSELNANPKQVQTHLRIDRAQTLLKGKKMSVTEVAYEVGYNSLSAFIKAYRNVTGKLPSN